MGSEGSVIAHAGGNSSGSTRRDRVDVVLRGREVEVMRVMRANSMVSSVQLGQARSIMETGGLLGCDDGGGGDVSCLRGFCCFSARA